MSENKPNQSQYQLAKDVNCIVVDASMGIQNPKRPDALEALGLPACSPTRLMSLRMDRLACQQVAGKMLDMVQVALNVGSPSPRVRSDLIALLDELERADSDLQLEDAKRIASNHFYKLVNVSDMFAIDVYQVLEFLYKLAHPDEGNHEDVALEEECTVPDCQHSLVDRDCMKSPWHHLRVEKALGIEPNTLKPDALDRPATITDNVLFAGRSKEDIERSLEDLAQFITVANNAERVQVVGLLSRTMCVRPETIIKAIPALAASPAGGFK